MTPTIITGATYGEFWPNGKGGTTLTMPPNAPDTILHQRWSNDSRMGGKAWRTYKVWYWTGVEWKALYDGNTPNSPVAFHPTNGNVYVAAADVLIFDRAGNRVGTIPGYVGSEGLRCVNADGSIVTGKDTETGLVDEWTPVGDLHIGQGVYGGVEAAFNGQRHVIVPSGDVEFLRVNSEGDAVTLYWTDFKNGYRLDTTLSAIRAIPPVIIPDTPVGPTTPARAADGRPYDTTPFIHCDPALSARGGPGQQENVQVDLAGGIILYGKFGAAGAYESYALDANWMYSLEDASGPTESQSWTDPRWFPVRQAIGESHAFVTGPHEAVYKDRRTCAELRRIPFNRKMWLHALWDGFYWGPDLKTRATIMRGYDPTAGYYSKGRIIEVRYEAFGAGWCRWEAHRSDLVYPGVQSPDPQWATRRAQFTDASLVQRVDFYRLGGGHVQPVLTGCVPQICPSYPPFSSYPIPVVQSEDISWLLPFLRRS